VAAPPSKDRAHSASDLAGILVSEFNELHDTAWIEVISKMDEVYSDLIRYEVDLEQKNAALEQAQQFIGSIIASMSDILVVCDHRGQIQQVNQALLDLTGMAAGDLIGHPLSALMAVEDAARFLLSRQVQEHEARLRSKDDGFTDLVAMNCSPRLDHQKRLPGMVIVGRPVGELRRAYEALNTAHMELKQAQQQLVQAEKMASLGRLVAGVAHELNNPVSFVNGNAHALSGYAARLTRYLNAIHDGIDPEQQSRLRAELRIDRILGDLGNLVEGTLEGAQRITEIVKNLRRLSFTNATERKRLDLGAVARDALGWVQRTSGPGLRIEDGLSDALPIEGLDGPLHQVFVNLAQNALDACEGRGETVLRLSGGAERDQAVIRLEDNGPGIAEADLLKVFDPFFTTKPVGKGTGLGLWVSWSIIRDHGGSIEAGNGPGGGACFTLRLPISG